MMVVSYYITALMSQCFFLEFLERNYVFFKGQRARGARPASD